MFLAGGTLRLGAMVVLAVVAVVLAVRLRDQRPLSRWRICAALGTWGIAAGVCLVAVVTLTGDGGTPASLSTPRWSTVNLVPGRTIASYADAVAHTPSVALRNLAGNLLLFAPVGAAAGFHPGVRARLATLGLVAGAIGVEAIQFVLPRSPDIDDVLLNVAGGVGALALGAIVGRLLQRRPAVGR